jgi:two-component system, chemotaxis family, chemotaxis protein CheY
MKYPDSVLIVEDDLDVADAISCILADEGFEAVHASDGHAALAMLEAGMRPSVILLDLMMPIMDGIEFRRRQTMNPHISAIPVVILSADHQVGERAREMGVAGFLRKPVAPSQIVAELRRAVTR